MIFNFILHYAMQRYMYFEFCRWKLVAVFDSCSLWPWNLSVHCLSLKIREYILTHEIVSSSVLWKFKLMFSLGNQSWPLLDIYPLDGVMCLIIMNWPWKIIDLSLCYHASEKINHRIKAFFNKTFKHIKDSCKII